MWLPVSTRAPSDPHLLWSPPTLWQGLTVWQAKMWQKNVTSEISSKRHCGFCLGLSLFPSLSDHLLWKKPDTMLGAAPWIGPCGEERKAPANSHVNELPADPKTWILSVDPKADPSRQFYQGFLILWNCERGFKLLIFRAVRYAKSRQLNTRWGASSLFAHYNYAYVTRLLWWLRQ